MPDITATVPTLWQTAIDACMSLGVDPSTLPALTSAKEIVEYMYTVYGVKLEPLYEEVSVMQQTGWTWVVNTPVNAAETTDMVVRGVTDLVVAEGGATSISQGKKIFGTVSKKIAVGSLIAVLGIDTFASQIGEIISRLEDFLTPYTTDGENVPVMIDENGKTYLDKRAIDSFRNGLIDLGVFNSGSFIGDDTVLPLGSTVTVDFTVDQCLNEIYDLLVECCVLNGESRSVAESYRSEILSYIHGATWTDVRGNKHTYNCNSFLNTHIGGIAGFFNVSNNPYFCYLKAGTYVLNNSVTYNGIQTVSNGNSGLRLTAGDPYATSFDALNIRDDSGDVGVKIYDVSQANLHTMEIGIQFDTKFISMKLPWDTYNYVTPTQYEVTYTHDLRYGYEDLRSNYAYYAPYYMKALAPKYGRLFNGTVGEAVPGFSPTVSAVGDNSKTLNEIFPTWTSNGVQMPAPLDSNLNNKTDFLPVSITDTQPFTTDHTATADDQEGNTSTDAQNQILEQMMELIQSLLKDPDNPAEVITPTIEVGDSGDTPPYIPPLISGASNGLWTIYNPTLAEVQQFGGWLWSDSIIDSIRRQFASPIDGVIGFMSLYATPITGERKTIKAGYLNSPVSAKEVTNQYITIDCGNVEVPEYYHTAIDYTRSHVSIYLPFIGIIPLDASVVTGSILNVTYRIDVLTGACLAQIKVIKRNSDAVMYTFTGNCAVQLPLTAGTYTGLIGTLTSLCSGAISAMSGNMIGVGASLMGMARSMGTNVQKSGSLASNAGALGIRIPYLILTHPTAYDAFIYNQVYGYPTNIYQRLSDLGGFVRVKDIHLDTISCTRQELQMIYDRLHEGVILT